MSNAAVLSRLDRLEKTILDRIDTMEANMKQAMDSQAHQMMMLTIAVGRVVNKLPLADNEKLTF